MERYDKYVKRILDAGAEAAKVVDPKIVVTAHWVRMKCQFGCDGYNNRLTCPPYSPTPEYTAKMLSEYSKALLFTFRSDKPGVERKKRRSVRHVLVEVEREMFLDGYYKAFGLSAGPCNYCTSCDVSRPCKYQEEARPSMEAAGIDVYQTCRNAGLKIEVVRTLKDVCTYVSLILIE